jgi:transcriptional regulator with XRE-family HTH domain
MSTKYALKSMEDSASLLTRARRRAAVSQRELALRAHTSQSVIARIERGQTIPSVETLDRLLAAAGFELRRTLEPKPVVHSHMLEDSARILRLSPVDRLREVANVSRFIAGARRA